MSEIILPRRKFLTGMATLFCAPAIVRASSLMPISVSQALTVEPFSWSWSLEELVAAARDSMPKIHFVNGLDLVTRREFTPDIYVKAYGDSSWP
jgi:hypothetical protein